MGALSKREEIRVFFSPFWQFVQPQVYQILLLELLFWFQPINLKKNIQFSKKFHKNDGIIFFFLKKHYFFPTCITIGKKTNLNFILQSPIFLVMLCNFTKFRKMLNFKIVFYLKKGIYFFMWNHLCNYRFSIDGVGSCTLTGIYFLIVAESHKSKSSRSKKSIVY